MVSRALTSIVSPQPRTQTPYPMGNDSSMLDVSENSNTTNSSSMYIEFDDDDDGVVTVGDNYMSSRRNSVVPMINVEKAERVSLMPVE